MISYFIINCYFKIFFYLILLMNCLFFIDYIAFIIDKFLMEIYSIGLNNLKIKG